MKNFRKNQSGFTLIELIVVMIIIGILVLLATPRFIRYVKDANATSLQVDAKTVHDADLYQNLKAYDEAGRVREISRGTEYTMEQIKKGIVKEADGTEKPESADKAGYKHPIFTEGFDNGVDASKPDFNGDDTDKLVYDFEQWMTAMASTYEASTGKETTRIEDGSAVIDDSKDGYDDFMASTYAPVSDKVLSSHIRNTRYGVNNFVVSTSGLAEGEAYFMGYIEDGDNILHVSLIPSMTIKE